MKWVNEFIMNKNKSIFINREFNRGKRDALVRNKY